MVQAMDMVQVELEKFDKLADPELHGYGRMRDYCRELSYKFQGGNVYGIIGECGNGGWTLSCTLTGRIALGTNDRIFINDKMADQRMLSHFGWYVGEGSVETTFLRNRARTIREQLLRASKDNSALNIDKIADLFELAPSRLDRRLEQVGNERWSASVAIGVAYRKQIFCYPWLNTNWIQSLYPRIEHCVKILKERGAIVIIPTSRFENLKGIADEFLDVDHLGN